MIRLGRVRKVNFKDLSSLFLRRSYNNLMLHLDICGPVLLSFQ